jgi:HD-GYP domain-containing protein (c-di-GMP phosphodiesterase class II)
MIDWFPTTTSSADPARDLVRWQGAVTMRRVARSIDDRHPSTTGHSERVAEMAADIAHHLGWSRRSVQRMREAGGIHDVGKVCVPESILQTPGALTADEYEIVKTHAVLGGEIASTVLTPRQVTWIRHHHERWDGHGYPDRLTAEEIPDGAAILSLADAWDAMTSRSWSRPALTRAAALEECDRESGRQFAPWAVAALRSVIEDRAPVAAPRYGRLRLISAA